MARAARGTSPYPLSPQGPTLVRTPEGARTVLTRPDVFTQPFDVSRRATFRLRGRRPTKDTPVLTPAQVGAGQRVFVGELARALEPYDARPARVDTLQLLRLPVARSTTAALLGDVADPVRDEIADLVLSWIDALGPIISAQRPPGRFRAERRREQRAWRALLRALRAAAVPDPAAVATALAAGIQVPIAAGAWCLTLLAADAGLRDAVRADRARCLAFVWETLRLYPPTWLLPRITTREVDVDGAIIPAYTAVVVSPVSLGRLSRLVPGPESGHADHANVDPTRWSGDVRPGAWLPFGAGPHACPGRNLGLAQLTELVDRAVEWELHGEAPRADTDRGLSPTPSTVSIHRRSGAEQDLPT